MGAPMRVMIPSRYRRTKDGIRPRHNGGEVMNLGGDFGCAFDNGFVEMFLVRTP